MLAPLMYTLVLGLPCYRAYALPWCCFCRAGGVAALQLRAAQRSASQLRRSWAVHAVEFFPVLFGRTISRSVTFSVPGPCHCICNVASRSCATREAAYALRSAELKLPHRKGWHRRNGRREQANAIGTSARGVLLARPAQWQAVFFSLLPQRRRRSVLMTSFRS